MDEFLAWLMEIFNFRPAGAELVEIAGATAAVPEIDASSGALALSAVIAALLLVRALRRRTGA